MKLTQSYEIQRDLLTGMAYHRGSTLVAQREYSYDSLGRPTVRNTSRQNSVKNDTFGYNNRSELTTATVNGNNYAYDYDNIGNRAAAVEDSSGVASRTEYTANNLNQYTAVGDFTPTFDADGNQTLVKTTTGIWSITYDAENRPVYFTNAETNTAIECSYDHMGRRATKKVTVAGSITLHQLYLYHTHVEELAELRPVVSPSTSDTSTEATCKLIQAHPFAPSPFQGKHCVFVQPALQPSSVLPAVTSPVATTPACGSSPGIRPSP